MAKSFEYTDIANDLEQGKTLSLEGQEKELMQLIWQSNIASELDTSKSFQKLDQKIHKNGKVFRINQLWYAAAAVLLVLGFAIFNYLQPTKYIAEIGSTSLIELPDESIIELQGGSELVVPRNFGKVDRNVGLNGMASFKVSPNSKKLFRVESNKGNVEVLGTTFTIVDYKEASLYLLQVKEGKVMYEKDQWKKELTKNQTISVIDGKISVANQEISESDKLIFKNLSVKDIVVLLENRFGKSINYDQSINDLKLNITIDKDSKLTSILKVLSETTDHPFSIQ